MSDVKLYIRSNRYRRHTEKNVFKYEQ